MTDLVSASVTTTELMRRCRRGDDTAWQHLVDRYARLVHSVAVRHGLPPDDVDDIGQEVFLALAQSMDAIEDPERLPGWLMTTARRLCWRAVQQRRREQPSPTGELGDIELPAAAQTVSSHFLAIGDLVAGWQRQEALARGFARLSERCRALLTLIFLDEEEPSYDAISVRLGVPKGSIGPTRNRCLSQLRSILEGLGFESE